MPTLMFPPPIQRIKSLTTPSPTQKHSTPMRSNMFPPLLLRLVLSITTYASQFRCRSSGFSFQVFGSAVHWCVAGLARLRGVNSPIRRTIQDRSLNTSSTMGVFRMNTLSHAAAPRLAAPNLEGTSFEGGGSLTSICPCGPRIATTALQSLQLWVQLCVLPIIAGRQSSRGQHTRQTIHIIKLRGASQFW